MGGRIVGCPARLGQQFPEIASVLQPLANLKRGPRLPTQRRSGRSGPAPAPLIRDYDARSPGGQATQILNLNKFALLLSPPSQ